MVTDVKEVKTSFCFLKKTSFIIATKINIPMEWITLSAGRQGALHLLVLQG